MITVRGLTKYYGEHAAVRNLDFDIESGEVVGFLGLNGAGKTTTLKILGCLLLPTSGTVVVEGIDALQQPHEIRKRIGFLPDTPPLYNEMTVGEFLTFAAHIRGIRGKAARLKVGEVEEKAALSHMHDEVIAGLSHGYRQRVSLAQALVHGPQLLIMDEPTGGLDPVQIVEMRALIQRLRGQHTVLVSSHILAEISKTCDRLLVIQEGEIVARGTEEEIAHKLDAGVDIEVDVRGQAEPADEALHAVPELTDITIVSAADGVVKLRAHSASDIRPEIVRVLVAANIDVMRVDKGASRLEKLFLQLAKAEAAETPAPKQAATGTEAA